MQGFAITFVGVLQVAGIIAAFQLGRQQERPEKKWPQGSMLDGGWKAWRTPMIIIVAVAAAVTVFLPILAGPGGLSRLFSGLGFSGAYGRSSAYGRSQMYPSGGGGSMYGSGGYGSSSYY